MVMALEGRGRAAECMRDNQNEAKLGNEIDPLIGRDRHSDINHLSHRVLVSLLNIEFRYFCPIKSSNIYTLLFEHY
jgi:hypothetical protein